MKNEERGQPPYQPAHDDQGSALGLLRGVIFSRQMEKGFGMLAAGNEPDFRRAIAPVRLSILVMPFQNSIFSQAPRRGAGEPQSLLLQVSKSNRPNPHSFTDNQPALRAQVPSCLFSPATLQDNPRRRNSWAYWMLFHTCFCSWLRVHSSTNYY